MMKEKEIRNDERKKVIEKIKDILFQYVETDIRDDVKFIGYINWEVIEEELSIIEQQDKN